MINYQNDIIASGNVTITFETVLRLNNCKQQLHVHTSYNLRALRVIIYIYIFDINLISVRAAAV